MKRILFITLVIALMAPTGLMAQKVYMESGKLILDMTVAAGMPAGAVTNVAKFPGSAASYSPSTSSAIANNLPNGSINATVYQKLEIAPLNVNASGVLASGDHYLTWVVAFTNCKNLTHNGVSGWRLPTQRELFMMQIFKPAIEALFGAQFGDFNHWSATEGTGTTAWSVNLRKSSTYGSGNGTTSVSNKGSTTNIVRCVREIP